MNWYLDVITKKYAQFDGRARRMEYWMFVLVNLIVSIGIAIVEGVLGLSTAVGGVTGPLSLLYSLALLIPGIALTVRRLHDTNHSGWFILLVFVFVIGWLILLLWYVREGDAGRNEYGPDPLREERKKQRLDDEGEVDEVE